MLNKSTFVWIVNTINNRKLGNIPTVSTSHHLCMYLLRLFPMKWSLRVWQWFWYEPMPLRNSNRTECERYLLMWLRLQTAGLTPGSQGIKFHLRCVIMFKSDVMNFENLNARLLPGTLLVDHPGIIDHIAWGSWDPQGHYSLYNTVPTVAAYLNCLL